MTVLREVIPFRESRGAVVLNALPFTLLSSALLPVLFSADNSAEVTLGEANGFGSAVAAEVGSPVGSLVGSDTELGSSGTINFNGFSGCN